MKKEIFNEVQQVFVDKFKESGVIIPKDLPSMMIQLEQIFDEEILKPCEKHQVNPSVGK